MQNDSPERRPGKTWKRFLLAALFLVLLLPPLEHMRKLLVGRWEAVSKVTEGSLGGGVLVIGRDGTYRTYYGPKSYIGNEGTYSFKGIFHLHQHMTAYWPMDLNEDGSVGDEGPGGRVDTGPGYRGPDFSMIDQACKVWINWRGDQMTLQYYDRWNTHRIYPAGFYRRLRNDEKIAVK